jgi:hypothetical protein
MFRMEPILPPVSDSQIDRFENDHGISLPLAYRRFLRSTNGGQPHSYTSFVIPEVGEEVLLGVLYGICDGQYGVSLGAMLAEFKDSLPEEYIPIGEDPGGNQLLLTLSGDHKDGIFYWDRVGFLARRADHSIFRVAANIDEFLDSLQAFKGG